MLDFWKNMLPIASRSCFQRYKQYFNPLLGNLKNTYLIIKSGRQI